MFGDGFEVKRSAAIKFQLVWGLALILVGVGVFFKVEQVQPQVVGRICLYIIGVILIGGGIRKLYAHFKAATIGENQDSSIDRMD